jgi:hypothetical protein
MTYITGGDIQAADHNLFATAAAGMNELYADMYPGATTLPNAGYGYGQPALSSVAIGDTITGIQWESVFNSMRATSTHQVNSNASVVPPLPATGPFAGQDIVAVTDQATMSGLIATLGSNRFALHSSQRSVLVGTSVSNPAAWTTQLVYTFQVDFGSWDNARYFFNTGGQVSVAAAYSPASTPDEASWADLFSTQFPISMNWQTTAPTAGGNLIASPPGFYADAPYPGLTTTYQSLFRAYAGIAPYASTNYAQIEAKLNTAPGTDGKIDYRVTLVDGDTDPELKPAGRMSVTDIRIQSAGAVPYPGTFTFTSGGFVST